MAKATRGAKSAAPAPEPERDEDEAARQEAERVAREGDENDDASDGDPLDGATGGGWNDDDDPEADLAAMSNVDHDAPAPEAGAGVVGIMPALTAGQAAGLDPTDVETHLRQASDRRPLTNAQTDHERENALDPVSGNPNPGVTKDVSHSASGEMGRSDMSGRKPFTDPVTNASPALRQAREKLGAASRKAIAERKRGHGWLTLAEIGVNKAIMDALVAAKEVVQDQRAGARFHPDSGVVYRLASHQEPDTAPVRSNDE